MSDETSPIRLTDHIRKKFDQYAELTDDPRPMIQIVEPCVKSRSSPDCASKPPSPLRQTSFEV